MVVCRRSLGELAAMAQQIDLVHFDYYLVAHAIIRVDDSLVAVRLISVLAMTTTAVLLVGIGRRLGSTQIGVLAGALLIVSPAASRYAQEAVRPRW